MARGTNVGDIFLNLGINKSGFSKEMNSMDGLVKSSVGKLAKAAAAAFTAKKIFDIGKQAVEVSSDLQEVQNVVDTAFGNMSYKMEQFADSAVKSFGMSRLSAKQTGSTFMAMAKGMDLPAEKASDMAVNLTGLSGDIASFYNISQDLASTKLKSVFTGETETLKDLGIVMTQTNLKQFALSKGITKNIDDMTQAELVQLRYAFIMKQTALAQGDFAKTQGSWANQTRILQEQWKEFLGILGNGLTQVLTPMIQALNSIVGKLITLGNAASKVFSEMFGGKQAEENTQNTANAIADVGDSTASASKKIKKSLAGFDELNKLTNGTADSSSAISDMLGDVGVYDLSKKKKNTDDTEDKIRDFAEKTKAVFKDLGSWYKSNFAPIFQNIWGKMKPQCLEFKSNLGHLFDGLKAEMPNLKKWFFSDFTQYMQNHIRVWGNIVVGLFDSFNMVFRDITDTVLLPFAHTAVNTILPMFTNLAMNIESVMGTAFSGIKTLFDTVWITAIVPTLQIFMGIWQEMWEVVSAKYYEYAEPIFSKLKEAINNTVLLLQNLWISIGKPILDEFLSILSDLWENNIKPFLEKALDFIGKLIVNLLDIYNKCLKPIFDFLVVKFGPVIVNVFKTSMAICGDLLATVIDVAGGFIEALSGIIDFITGIFTGDLGKALNGISEIFSGTFSSIAAMAKGSVNILIDIINKLIGGINTALAGMGELFGTGSIQFPTIPKLAKGGIITQPTLAMVGERGKEAVMPLENNTGWIDNLANQLAGRIGGSTQSSGSTNATVILELNGTELGRAVINSINEYQRQTGVVMV